MDADQLDFFVQLQILCCVVSSQESSGNHVLYCGPCCVTRLAQRHSKCGQWKNYFGNSSLWIQKYTIPFFLKTCSLFFKTNKQTRGYSNDPVLVFAKEWFVHTISTDFPALQTNDTSMDESMTTENDNLIYTGKGDLSQIFGFVRYQNQSFLHACTIPLENSNICPLYQAGTLLLSISGNNKPSIQHVYRSDSGLSVIVPSEWTPEEAKSNGWTPVWATDKANHIFGTDGTQFATKLKENTQIPIFVDALQRSWVLAAFYFIFWVCVCVWCFHERHYWTPLDRIRWETGRTWSTQMEKLGVICMVLTCCGIVCAIKIWWIQQPMLTTTHLVLMDWWISQVL